MKRGTPDHPKIYDLCDRLRVKRPTVIGYLEMLWHFTATFAPQGDVGKYSDARIEAAMDWSGRPGKLVEAEVNSRWLDRHPDPAVRLVVHDWHDHADDAVRKRLFRGGKDFLSRGVQAFQSVNGKVTGQSSVSDRTESGQILTPEPEPEPEPSPEPAAAASYRNGSLAPAVSTTTTDTLPDSHPIPQVRGLLHEYVTHLCHLDWPPPDDQICTQVLLAAGDAEELQQKLIVLWKQKHGQPNRSYAWFISAVRSVK
jgi:hypothetical protein